MAKAKIRKCVPTDEDARLAEVVSRKLRGLSCKSRSERLRDTILDVLTLSGYNTPDERGARYRGICSVLGARGAAKRNSQLRAVERKPTKTTAATSIWPDVRDDMPEMERELALLRRDQLTGEALTLARLRRDDLAREADGE